MSAIDPELLERAGRIRLVLLDADGVLTDGSIFVGAGGTDLRAFHVRDGLAVRLGQRGGLVFGIVSGRRSEAVAARAGELDIREVHQGILDKSACVDGILERLGFPAEATCYVGDDLVDLPVMRRVGLAVAPKDAAPEARETADWVTSVGGGRGAVREVVDLLLRASGKWQQATRRFME